jgi:hypothetical protein
MSVIFALLILLFKMLESESIINIVYKVASYTYGPLLGLFAFGMFTRIPIKDKWVPLVAVLSPILCLILSEASPYIFNGYKIGFELLIVNGMFTFIGLLLLRNRKAG